MKTTVSDDWQTEIPQEIRELFNIEPGSTLEWEVRDGYAVVHPLPVDPVRASHGLFKRLGPTTVDLLTERRKDLELEEEIERRLGIPPAPGRAMD
jgi:AbrB family looped-hinge helix DNA binding protein